MNDNNTIARQLLVRILYSSQIIQPNDHKRTTTSNWICCFSNHSTDAKRPLFRTTHIDGKVFHWKEPQPNRSRNHFHASGSALRVQRLSWVRFIHIVIATRVMEQFSAASTRHLYQHIPELRSHKFTLIYVRGMDGAVFDEHRWNADLSLALLLPCILSVGSR